MDTIGGNILQVSTDQARILTDFGLKAARNIVEGTTCTQLEKSIVQEELPAIEGIFSQKDIMHMESLEPIDQEQRAQAVLISHLHIDHMGALKYLPEQVSVYMSKDSHRLYQELITIGEESKISARIKGLDYGQWENIGNINFAFFESDHDIKGASAVFIETPDLKLIHSGDLRLTGMSPEKVKNMVQLANKFDPDLLFLEATSYSFDKDTQEVEDKEKDWSSEQELLDGFERILKSSDELFVINPYSRNVERMYHLNQRALKVGRQIIWEPAFSHLIQCFYPDASVADLAELSGSTTSGKKVSLDEVRANPHKYVLHNSFKNRHLLSGLQGTYLHMNGEPLGDFDSNYDLLMDYLEKIKMTYRRFGASGHASRDDLIEVAKGIGARYTVSWHSFQPGLFEKALRNNNLQTIKPLHGQVFNKEDL